MTDLATRIMRIDEASGADNTARAIFGSIGDMAKSIQARPTLRVGMWPCLSESFPLQAMGVWSALAYLLESWDDIRLYRLFVELDGDPDTFKWSLDKTQFAVDDWYVEKLDENVAVWGELKQFENAYHLTVFIEDDNAMNLAEELEVDEVPILEITTSASSIAALIEKLPTLAREIAAAINAERRREITPMFNAEPVGQVSEIFSSVVEWEAHLLMYLWGKAWDDKSILDLYDQMVSVAIEKLPESDFEAWLCSHAIAQAMRPGYSVIGDLLVEPVAQFIRDTGNKSAMPATIIAPKLYDMGYSQRAYELLEELAQQEEYPILFVRLAELYLNSNRLGDSIDILQRAIEMDIADTTLYRVYGNTISLAEQYGEVLSACVLVDPQKFPQEFAIHESIQAFERALAANPDDIKAIYGKLDQKMKIASIDDDFWANFGQLARTDKEGDYLSNVVDSLYMVDTMSIDQGIHILEELLAEEQRRDIMINVALLHLIQGDGDTAMSYLENALALSSDIASKAEVERLMLAAKDEDFDYRFGELAAVVQAGNELSTDDVDFLEQVVKKAPHFLDGHLLLAKAYDIWGDSDAALEVLLDVNQELPISSDVIGYISKLLWESDEKELAFEYLNQGLRAFPNNIALLVRTARYLFDNGQLDQARTFLAHAEEIEPRSQQLQQIRGYISRKIAEDPDLYQSSN